MIVRPARVEDGPAWELMRQSLWPSPPGTHASEIARFFDGHRQDPAEVFIAIDEAGGAAGFAELSIRSHAEGCEPGRIAYLEGWYIVPAFRRTGVGTALIAGAEQWALSQGCAELASDAEFGNIDSASAHLACGFEEVGRIVCFKKRLLPES